MIESIDHLVLTVHSLERSCDFYVGVLGLDRVDDPGRPTSVGTGSQKINLHEVGHTFEPKAAHPTPGSGDLCLVTRCSIADVVARLRACNIPVEVGPVERAGARGPMTSVYVRDPDQNLVEIARYHGV